MPKPGMSTYESRGMLTSTAGSPLAGMCRTMMVSDRCPPMPRPVASSRSSFLVSPWRLSEPVISQFCPAPATGRPA